MDNPKSVYWNLRLGALRLALEENGFEAHVAETAGEARKLVLDTIIPSLNPASVSWGGSMSMVETGLYDALKNSENMEVLDTFDKSLSPEDKNERRRKALLTDLYITGTNAITESGMLVNLDMIGNRVAAIVYGPRNVVIIVGRNKLVADLGEAMERIRDYAAPVNTMRLDMKTPCRKTGRCHDCDSPQRICNHWTINERCFPKGRIKVILVNEELGF